MVGVTKMAYKDYNYENLFNFCQGYWVAGFHRDERFGQAFFNEFGIKPCGIDVFHEINDDKVSSLIWKGLTEYEENKLKNSK